MADRMRKRKYAVQLLQVMMRESSYNVLFLIIINIAAGVMPAVSVIAINWVFNSVYFSLSNNLSLKTAIILILAFAFLGWHPGF